MTKGEARRREKAPGHRVTERDAGTGRRRDVARDADQAGGRPLVVQEAAGGHAEPSRRVVAAGGANLDAHDPARLQRLADDRTRHAEDG